MKSAGPFLVMLLVFWSQLASVSTQEPPVPVNRCQLPAKSRRCGIYSPRYFYSPAKNRCLFYPFGGCPGNGNSFATEQECQDACMDFSTICRRCRLTPERGRCKENSLAFYYHPVLAVCLLFDYSGCGGNSNDFQTEADCDMACRLPCSGVLENLCQLPAKSGTCSEHLERYYYNTTEKKCQEFIFTGCAGNINNFETEQDCQESCGEISQACSDRCQLPAQSGYCRERKTHYYYNAAQKRCQTFIFSGCRGNRNNFETEEECQEACGELSPVCSEQCQLPPKFGSCPRRFIRYYYNPAEKRCLEFIFSGCGGNKNNFETEEQCLEACGESV